MEGRRCTLDVIHTPNRLSVQCSRTSCAAFRALDKDNAAALAFHTFCAIFAQYGKCYEGDSSTLSSTIPEHGEHAKPAYRSISSYARA